MKKFLLIAALILALVTSLSAGTMAMYTSNVTTIEDANVFTKVWSISATSLDTQLTEAVKLAPGDKAIYKIKVTNASEVKATLNMLYSMEGAPVGMSMKSDNAESTEIAKDGIEMYTFTLAYDYDEGTEPNKAFTFNVWLNATSVNEATENVIEAA